MDRDDLLQGDSRNQIRKKAPSTIKSDESIQKLTPIIATSKNNNDSEIVKQKKRNSIGYNLGGVDTNKNSKKKNEEEIVTTVVTRRKSLKRDSNDEEKATTTSTSTTSSVASKIVPKTTLETNDENIPVRRRTKSLGGAITSKSNDKDLTNNKSTTTTTTTSSSVAAPIKVKLEPTTTNNTTKTIPSSISTSTNSGNSNTTANSNLSHKRKSLEPEDNIFQADRYVKNKEKDEMLKKQQNENEKDNEKEKARKKTRYSIAGVKTQFEKDKEIEKELETKKQAERLEELNRLKRQHDLEEERERQRREKEKEREAEREQRLAKLKNTLNDNKKKLPVLGTTSGISSRPIPIPTTTQHVYPKTPGPTASNFGYNDYPTSKLVFNNPSKHISLSDVVFDEDETETVVINNKNNNNSNNSNEDEEEFSFSFSSEDESNEIEEKTSQQEKKQSTLQQQKKQTQNRPTVEEEQSLSSYLLVFISFLVWISLLFVMLRFFYKFNEIKYCDTDNVPQILPNGKYSCVLCPDKGVCLNDVFYGCVDGYIKSGQICIIDPSRVTAISNVFTNVDQILRDHKGKFECGVLPSMEMSAGQLDQEFDRRYWIKNDLVQTSYKKLLNAITNGGNQISETTELGIDREMLSSIHASYDPETKEYSFYTDHNANHPLWCQTYFTLRQLVLNYLPVLIGIVAGYVFYRYYKYKQQRKEEELLIIDDYTKDMMALLKWKSQDVEEPWMSEIMLKEEIIGDDRSEKTLRLWDIAREKLLQSTTKVLNTPRFVYGESQDTFEYSASGIFKESTTPKKSNQPVEIEDLDE